MTTLTDQQLENWGWLEEMVWLENDLQVRKWGIQTRTPFEWMTYLTEEVGELAKAINEVQYREEVARKVIKEAIQAATLALKIAEMYKIIK